MHTISPTEMSALNWLSAQQDAMFEQTQHWTTVNTGSQNLSGLAQMSQLLKTEFQALGDVTLLPPTKVEAINAEGELVQVTRGYNLYLSTRPQAPVQVVLTGHMDTVFGLSHPFQVGRGKEGGALNAPGAADMKGGLSVMLHALKAFEQHPAALELGYQVIINSDEEVSSLGSAALLAKAAAKAELGLVFEPAQVNGTLAGARKGIGSYTAIVKGRGAHAGRNPELGRNAIIAAADLFVELAKLSSAREGLTVNPARIDGGGPTNVVPELAVGRFEVRVKLHEDRDFADTEIKRIAKMIAARHEVKIDLHGRFNRPPKPLDKKQLELFEAIKHCGADLDIPVTWQASGGCCDGNNLADAGLSVVDTLGVRGGNIHTKDEFMVIESLSERAKLSALLLMRLATGAISLSPKLQP